MDASAALVLILAAGLDSPDVRRSATSPSPGTRVLAGLSRLALEKVRVRVDGAAYVLRFPQFEADGIGWRSVDGFPRRRPAPVSGADGDSVPTPSNPLPWRAGMRLEAASDRPGAGAGLGALALSAASAPESIATNLSPAPGAPALVDAVPPDTLVRELSRLGLRRARVTLKGHPFVLEAPAFLGDGIAWAAVEGFPRRRPAIVAGADWDSVKPPPNPVPWERIERLETPRANRGSGAVIGGITGFVLVGLPVLGLTAAVREYDQSSDDSILGVGFGIAIGATLVGASLGHLLIPPTQRWEPVAWPPAPAVDSTARQAPGAER